MHPYEQRLQEQGFPYIIGVDEAGRGPLAGPVVAAAVMLTGACFSCRIDDSKKLSSRQRTLAFPEIIEKSVSGVSVVSEQVIDQMNILRASLLAMQQAVQELLAKVRRHDAPLSGVHILVDGNHSIDAGYPCTPIVNGDARCLSIAAASIVAKVTRDRIMDDYERTFPGYGFGRHKGYPTQAHREALARLGPTRIHRRSFAGV